MTSPVAVPTPEQIDVAIGVIASFLEETPTVTLRLRGRPTAVKLETMQTTGSFKIRGALAAVSAAHRDDPTGAVITASAGNHGLGIAHASSLLDVPATVVVPANASPAKVKKLRRYPIELIEHGSSYDDAQAHARELADARAICFISAFNDTHVMAGQSTLFFELFRQAPDVEHLVIPVGGGGLLSGAILARNMTGRTDIGLTGVQPKNSAAMYHVLHGVSEADILHQPTIADGLAGGGDEGSTTNALIAEHGIPLVLVDEAFIRQGVREGVETTGLVMEGSAATPYAAIIRQLAATDGQRVGFIASGRNIAYELLLELLEEPIEE